MNNKHEYHRDCEDHTASTCDINDHNNLDPEFDDCGHTVSKGPGVGIPKYAGKLEPILASGKRTSKHRSKSK